MSGDDGSYKTNTTLQMNAISLLLWFLYCNKIDNNEQKISMTSNQIPGTLIAQNPMIPIIPIHNNAVWM